MNKLKPLMIPEKQKQVHEWLNELLREKLNPGMRKELVEKESAVTPEIELVEVAQAIRTAVKTLDTTSENHR